MCDVVIYLHVVSQVMNTVHLSRGSLFPSLNIGFMCAAIYYTVAEMKKRFGCLCALLLLSVGQFCIDSNVGLTY